MDNNQKNDQNEVISNPKAVSKKTKSTQNPSLIDNGRVYRSRQSARECRQRKKARYKKLDDAIMIKESENLEFLRKIERLNQLSSVIDNGGTIPPQELETIRNDLHLLPNIIRRYNNGNPGVS